MSEQQQVQEAVQQQVQEAVQQQVQEAVQERNHWGLRERYPIPRRGGRGGNQNNRQQHENNTAQVRRNGNKMRFPYETANPTDIKYDVLREVDAMLDHYIEATANNRPNDATIARNYIEMVFRTKVNIMNLDNELFVIPRNGSVRMMAKRFKQVLGLGKRNENA